MSDGDEEPDDGGDLGVEEFEARLDDAEAALADADTEAALDDVEATLDGVADDLEAADLPEADDDEESPREALEDRLSDLRDDLEDARGPYAEEVVETVESVQSTVENTRWTGTGEDELADAVAAFVDDVEAAIDAEVTADGGDDPDGLAVTLEAVARAVEGADLDPDDDADAIAALVEAADDLEAAVDDAEEWDDLSVRQQLRAEGFYDVLGEKHKDYPPEWSALKEWEKRDDVEMVLLLLEKMGDSGFMERHCLDALRRMGHPGAKEEMLSRAQKRGKPAIEVLGKIGEPDEDVLDAIEEYAESGDAQLRRTTLRALGEMGATDALQTVADQLAADDAAVRSSAARSLGLIGDPRAVEPLADVLAGDDADQVRTSAAWALVQIGTEEALRTAAEYADDDSFVVQSEAEVAEEALATGAPA